MFRLMSLKIFLKNFVWIKRRIKMVRNSDLASLSVKLKCFSIQVLLVFTTKYVETCSVKHYTFKLFFFCSLPTLAVLQSPKTWSICLSLWLWWFGVTGAAGSSDLLRVLQGLINREIEICVLSYLFIYKKMYWPKYVKYVKPK